VISRSQRVFALVFSLLVVYMGSPAMHMDVIGSHDHSHATLHENRPAAHRSHVTLPGETQGSSGAHDDSSAPTRQSIPHCDLEVSQAANPPSFTLDPPGYVTASTVQPIPASSSIALDPPSLPPRQS
jgi:hypothetical protein